MSSYVASRTPHFHWQWASGTGYGVSNLCGLDGRLLATNTLQDLWDDVEEACTNAGCGVMVLNLLAGFPSGQNSSVATWGVLETNYSHITDWLTNVFPSRRIPGRKYGLYMGGRQREPYNLNQFNDGSTESIPPGSFFVDAVANFRSLGFDVMWTDATEGEPALRPAGPNANNVMVSAGWRVGAELIPHTGIIYSGNTLDVQDDILPQRPHMAVWRNWRDLYRSRFTRNLPGNVEVHICPQFGDTDFTTSVVDELLGKGFVISPYFGFEVTAPSVVSYIAQKQRANLQTARTRSRGR